MTQLNRRSVLAAGVAAGAVSVLPSRAKATPLANDEINLGFISCGGRAGQLMGGFAELDGVNIAGLCDPDEGKLGAAMKKFPKAQGWADLRDLIKSPSIDAVVIATCNHWHCLAAIWAMEAGKHVYVEKPLSHSQWEGRQTVAAARKYSKICQVGTQQRSDPMQAEIKKFLHEEKAIGEIQSARVNRYGIRPSIGKRDKPLEIDDSVAYDLWLGPAQDQPLFRDNLHYDWHWDWNTGSGEMGNWGVHVLDDVRNNVFQDSVSLPSKIVGGGGRVALNDAGNTPNVHFVHFETGAIPVVIGLSNLPAEPGGRKTPEHPGPNSGYVAYTEGGRFEGQRGGGAAYDSDGKLIKKFKGTSGLREHKENFVAALRANDASILNADVAVGNDSTGWCNLANIAFRAGGDFTMKDAGNVSDKQWNSLVGDMKAHLAAHDIDIEGGEIRLSSQLVVDEASENFTGAGSEAANVFIKREYRKGYEVPEIV